MSINQNLRQLRLASKLTQEQVADQIGVTRQALSSYESGRTRPDIDMLMRLSEVYHTDLDGIIYGQNRAVKSVRRVKRTAVVIAALLAVFTAVSSALLWCANRFFAIAEGALSPEKMAVFTVRQRLIGAKEGIDEVILTISLVGFALLLVLLVAGKNSVRFRVKLTYAACLAVTLFAIAALFGATDAVFTLTDYIIIPVFAVARMAMFFLLDLIVEFVQKKKSRRLSQ